MWWSCLSFAWYNNQVSCLAVQLELNFRKYHFYETRQLCKVWTLMMCAMPLSVCNLKAMRHGWFEQGSWEFNYAASLRSYPHIHSFRMSGLETILSETLLGPVLPCRSAAWFGNCWLSEVTGLITCAVEKLMVMLSHFPSSRRPSWTSHGPEYRG